MTGIRVAFLPGTVWSASRDTLPLTVTASPAPPLPGVSFFSR